MTELTAPLPLVRLGTRGSALARWQTDYIAASLQRVWPGLPVEITVLHTQGDRILDKPLPAIGGKGLFTAELEEALRTRAIDLAVHSLKDLPTELEPGLIIGAIPARAPVHDVLVSRHRLRLDELPPGALIGTSSRRRAAQIRHRFEGFGMLDIRGNVDTRIRKALDPAGPYDAIVLAQAGIERLGHTAAISQILPLDLMLPAPGQGALAVQCRDEEALRALLAPLEDAATRAAVEAERAFLGGLGGGCSVPVAAYGAISDGLLTVRGRVTAVDGARQIDVQVQGDPNEAADLGRQLAQLARAQGAGSLLGEAV
jgi:hydroxymethylbilane synthase